MSKSWAPRKWGALLLCALAAAACGDDDSDGDNEDDDSDGASEEGVGDASVAVGDSSACSALTYESFGKPFLDTYCVSCHGGNVKGSARMAAPVDAVFDTVEQVRAKDDELKEQVVVMKVMPFGNTSLKPSDGDRVKFGQWLDCGAP